MGSIVRNNDFIGYATIPFLALESLRLASSRTKLALLKKGQGIIHDRVSAVLSFAVAFLCGIGGFCVENVACCKLQVKSPGDAHAALLLAAAVCGSIVRIS